MLELKNIRYSVDAPEGHTEILRDISLTIPDKKLVVLTGPNGGGKSTLCQLIPRFYDVTGGAVFVDGQDVRKVTQASLHRYIGIIQQDVFLFADTVRENIRYGRPDATDEEIVEAAVRAQIHSEIMEMPKPPATRFLMDS